MVKLLVLNLTEVSLIKQVSNQIWIVNIYTNMSLKKLDFVMYASQVAFICYVLKNKML